MKDLITTALDNQQTENFREFCGNVQDENETDETENGFTGSLNLDRIESFNGLHPNHVAQMRSKLAYGAYFGNSSHSKVFADTHICD
jgi:hypothetical protein